MPASPRIPAAVLLVAAIAGGCIGSASAPPPSPAPASASAASPTVTGAASASAAAAATPASTTATAWGPILDAPPASFPAYPGAAEANGVTNEPVTASLATDASVATVSAWYRDALKAAGYTQTTLGNPAEDGSVVGEYDGSTVAPGCRARITYEPQGTKTFVLALVGAACR